MTSSYKYYYNFFATRVLLQKFYIQYPVNVSSVYIEVSSNTLSNVDDISILKSLRAIELISGQKPFIMSSGSRYVGTSKRSYFSAAVNIRNNNIFSFLELLTSCFVPNFQKRIGVLSDSSMLKGNQFTVACKDIQLFTGYEGPTVPYNLLITLAPNFAGFPFFDLLQLYKFNFLR